MTRWPLTAVLELAAGREAGARARLAAALAHEHELVRDRSAASDDLAAARAAEGRAGDALRHAGPRAGDLAAGARHLARTAEEVARRTQALRAATAAEAAAAADVRSRRDALIAARAEVETLEGHLARWRAAEARRRDRAEDAGTDDLVSARPAAAR